MRVLLVCIACLLLMPAWSMAQSHPNHWSKTERQLRYRPDGTDFVIVDGTKRFNRALYGTETAFRVETGDLPEFALYPSAFGGNIQLGIIHNGQSKWVTQAQHIEARYKGAAMDYTVTDPLWDNVPIRINVLALADAEGMVVKVSSGKPLKNVSLVCVYGGGTGKRFRREGDMNTDPESIFYLAPQNCAGASVTVADSRFVLQYGSGKAYDAQTLLSGDASLSFAQQKEMKRVMAGVFPVDAKLMVGDANNMQTPIAMLSPSPNEAPVLVGRMDGLDTNGRYLLWRVPQSPSDLGLSANAVPEAYQKAEQSRLQLTSRMVLQTPDAYINTLGPTLASAADGIFETPTYLHGAIGWRMRLNGWRGPYTADPMGWHDRAKAHIEAYAQSQVTSPESGPSVPDPKTNLARQQEKMGNALFTSGYICRNPNGDFRPHHYDMNLVFIDNMLRHFRWTGDKAFMRDMWPVLTRHLAWEKRNFDGDNDGLYDAYCCIWASDALEYSGGGVAHSSAYNYLANKMAAQIAQALNLDATAYQREADKILNAIRTRLWLSNKGWFAEYVDWTGLKRTHDASALWTIYHVLDSEVADPFQAWQSSRYVEANLPKLPVKGVGLADDGYYVHSTTNWQPYDWSINNVVMAENLHMALAHWQAGRSREGFHLWKSTLLDAMYLGGSPGNFVQLSFLDAARGEMYRDFADEVGMTARSLVEGLFGILPDALHGQLTIQPGFPSHWGFANLKTPYIDYRYQQKGRVDAYTFKTSFALPLALTLKVAAKYDGVAWVKVNGKKASWRLDDKSVGAPVLLIDGGKASTTLVEIKWKGKPLATSPNETLAAQGENISVAVGNCTVDEVFDPQQVLEKASIGANQISGKVHGQMGARSFFAKVKQGQMAWWMPIPVSVVPAVQVVAKTTSDGATFTVTNHTARELTASVRVNHRPSGTNISVGPGKQSGLQAIDSRWLMVGSNLVELLDNGKVVASATISNWEIGTLVSTGQQQTIDLSGHFNDKVTQIFKNEYLSPRWPYPTLQLPKHGVGNWCYNNIHPVIDDSGIRTIAQQSGSVGTPMGIVFQTPADTLRNNVVFASLYDNYPDSSGLPLDGSAKHLYLLMVGTTNPMQSQIVNGVVKVYYTDGTFDALELINPENWSPIEQDYFHDGYAFNIQSPMPPRLHLKTGLVSNGNSFDGYTSINGYSNRIIDGGAANILDLPLNPDKTLQRLVLEVHSNEVVMGIMGVTLVR